MIMFRVIRMENGITPGKIGSLNLLKVDLFVDLTDTLNISRTHIENIISLNISFYIL
jgi:hypothetical protein